MSSSSKITETKGFRELVSPQVGPKHCYSQEHLKNGIRAFQKQKLWPEKRVLGNAMQLREIDKIRSNSALNKNNDNPLIFFEGKWNRLNDPGQSSNSGKSSTTDRATETLPHFDYGERVNSSFLTEEPFLSVKTTDKSVIEPEPSRLKDKTNYMSEKKISVNKIMSKSNPPYKQHFQSDLIKFPELLSNPGKPRFKSPGSLNFSPKTYCSAENKNSPSRNKVSPLLLPPSEEIPDASRKRCLRTPDKYPGFVPPSSSLSLSSSPVSLPSSSSSLSASLSALLSPLRPWSPEASGISENKSEEVKYPISSSNPQDTFPEKEIEYEGETTLSSRLLREKSMMLGFKLDNDNRSNIENNLNQKNSNKRLDNCQTKSDQDLCENLSVHCTSLGRRQEVIDILGQKYPIDRVSSPKKNYSEHPIHFGNITPPDSNVNPKDSKEIKKPAACSIGTPWTSPESLIPSKENSFEGEPIFGTCQEYPSTRNKSSIRNPNVEAEGCSVRNQRSGSSDFSDLFGLYTRRVSEISADIGRAIISSEIITGTGFPGDLFDRNEKNQVNNVNEFNNKQYASSKHWISQGKDTKKLIAKERVKIFLELNNVIKRLSELRGSLRNSLDTSSLTQSNMNLLDPKNGSAHSLAFDTEKQGCKLPSQACPFSKMEAGTDTDKNGKVLDCSYIKEGTPNFSWIDFFNNCQPIA